MEQKVELEILIKAKNDNSDVFHDKSLKLEINSNGHVPIEKALETYDVIKLLDMFLKMNIYTIRKYMQNVCINQPYVCIIIGKKHLT